MTRPDFPDNALYRSTASHAKRATQPAHATVHEANTSGPRQFIPYLYICPPRSPDAIPAGPWTHILRLFPPSKTRPAGASGLSAHALDLHLPSAAFTNTRALHLSEEHLLLARDFLALALPYYASAHPVEPSSPFARSGRAYTPITHAPLQGMMRMPQPLHSSRADPVRVLVIGPPRAALAIALTYLAYASGCTVAEVMHGVRDGDADAEWRRMLGKDGQMGLGRADMGTLERVAIQEM
ncbi:hypothetical protein B0H15DRAFT_798924 [Mycena belliarum]|uniref:Uncharacterized protein n=1 Tax=Mycena belliarum TaxID=1033014 RepID=A0AAD6XWT4_9AGAR|nr:hypothetical protein B0H15DRAFT_798924 [Mycena belliae]